MSRHAPTCPAPPVAGPARRWLVALLLLSLVGLGASAYLSVLHWKVHNQPGHVSFCALSEAVNCDTAALSSYSRVAGVPVATWGILFYSLFTALAAWGLLARRAPWPWGLASALNAAAVGVSAFLALVSEAIIQSLCLFCTALYLVNALAAGVCVLGMRRAGLPSRGAAAPPLVGLLGGLAAFGLHAPGSLGEAWPWLAGLGAPGLALLALVLVRRPLHGARAWGGAVVHDLRFPFRRRWVGVALAALAAGVVAAALILVPRMYARGPAVLAGGPEGLATGRTPEGHAWIGAEHPEVTIVEFSDYECPFCGRAHEVVRTVVREHRDWLRLVHVHFPLDQKCNRMLERPFHLRACESAMAAVCADAQGAFWRVNDALFGRRGGLDAGGLAVLAGELGLDVTRFRACMRDAATREAVARDIELGLARRFRGTPAFLLGDELVLGLKDQAWWREAVRRQRAGGRERDGGSQDPRGR